jgi:hypothetical protein
MRAISTPLRQALLVAALFVAFISPRAAHAQCTGVGDCLLPRVGCGYFGQGPISYAVIPTPVQVRNVNFSSFTQCMAPLAPGITASSFFDVFVEFEISTNNGVSWLPAQVTGHGTEHAVGHADLVTFDTEMLQMDLAGGSIPLGIMIRESPTKASTGTSVLTDQGGGNFNLNSFFDVFTELSVDGGVSWTPSGSSTRITVTTESPTPARTATWGALKMLYR